MDISIREQITNLRHTLHACPEISGQEEPLISAGTMDMHRRSAAWH